MDLRERWRSLAGDLGFVYKPGLQGFVDAPRLISMVGSEIHLFKSWERKAAFLDNKLFAAVAEKLHPGMAFGDWQGYRCALFPAGRAHSTRVTAYRAHIFHLHAVLLFGRPLDLDLMIDGGAGPAARVVKGLFGRMLIRFPGNPELDGMVTASARRREEAEALLSAGAVQQGLTGLYRASQFFRVTDEGIRYRRQGDAMDPGTAAGLLDLMARAADAVSRAAGGCAVNGGPGASPSPPA